MAAFDIDSDDWVEIVPAGGTRLQQVTVTMGVALVALGDDTDGESAFQLGGTEAESMIVAAGSSVRAMRHTPRCLITVGDYSSIDFAPDPTPLPDNQAAVTNGDTLAITNSAGADAHNATVAVSGNSVTSTKLAATVALVDNADAVAVQNSAGTAVAGTHAATVAAGVLSNVKLAATIAPVITGSQTVTDGAGKASTATRTVAAGVVSSEVLAATDCIVKSGNTFTAADGGTISVTVAAGVPTFTYTAP